MPPGHLARSRLSVLPSLPGLEAGREQRASENLGIPTLPSTCWSQQPGAPVFSVEQAPALSQAVGTHTLQVQIVKGISLDLRTWKSSLSCSFLVSALSPVTLQCCVFLNP